MSSHSQVAPAPQAPVRERDRSMAEVVARRLLRIEDAAPRSLMPMRGSLMLSAVRCLLTYVAIPVVLPLAGWLAPIAAPLSLALTVAAFVMAVVSLRRVWMADWSKRWAYTGFAVVVLAVLSVLIVIDVRAIV